jgi:NADH:ubiquinone oxidoreductase subunit 4 (subunit M)
VLMASVYMLRVFIRTMHNRAGPEVASRELSWRDALVLVPFIGAIMLFAIYPQIELSRAQGSVTSSITTAAANAAATAATPVASTTPSVKVTVGATYSSTRPANK